jgi:ABC-type multidrug transport system fused ATPase/permease subunit
MSDSPSVSETPTVVAKTSLGTWFQRHKEKLWWLHSGYALLLGIGIMWMGARNYNYLRVTVFHLGFIWLSSFFLPKLLRQPWLPVRWAPRLRLVVNYFNKNLYQQALFFVLPIYYASSTFGSRNFLFVLALGISALLSTLDVVYDRHLSVSRMLTALFFAFNLFALVNVMLPVLWSVSNTWTTRIGALLAALGLVTLLDPFPQAKRWRYSCALIAAVVLAFVVERGRSFVPPAPLRLVSAEFGAGYEPAEMRLAPPINEITPGRTRQLHALTAIKAPLGLRERVQHRWYKNGLLVWASPLIEVIGGREQGFRLRTTFVFDNVEAAAQNLTYILPYE